MQLNLVAFFIYFAIIKESRGFTLSKKEKLIERLKSKPKDFTFYEMESLLGQIGYICLNKGSTSGSRVMFIHSVYAPIILHKPHPNKELPYYVTKQIYDKLKREGVI